jgi:hypothetical protein
MGVSDVILNNAFGAERIPLEAAQAAPISASSS